MNEVKSPVSASRLALTAIALGLLIAGLVLSGVFNDEPTPPQEIGSVGLTAATEGAGHRSPMVGDDAGRRKQVPGIAEGGSGAMGDEDPTDPELASELEEIWSFDERTSDDSHSGFIEEGRYPPQKFKVINPGYFRTRPEPSTMKEFVNFLVERYMDAPEAAARVYGYATEVSADKAIRDLESSLGVSLDNGQRDVVSGVIERYRLDLELLSQSATSLAEALYVDHLARKDFVTFQKGEMPPHKKSVHDSALHEYVTYGGFYADVTFDPYASSAFASAMEEFQGLYGMVLLEARSAAGL